MSDRHDDMNKAFGMIESIYSSLVCSNVKTSWAELVAFSPHTRAQHSDAQRSENAELQSELRSLHKQLEHNRRQQVQTVEALRAENESLMKHNDMLQGEVSRLRRVESDRIVRSALDQSSDGRDTHESSSLHREWANSSSQPLGVPVDSPAPSSGHFSTSTQSAYKVNAHGLGRPPRVPSHPASSGYSGVGVGSMFDLDTSGVSPAGGAHGSSGADSMDDSIASSRSLLRALQGSTPAPLPAQPDGGDDGELALLMSALSAAAGPSSSSNAGATASMATSTASTATSTPGRAVPGDHVLNSTRGSVAEQLQRVSAAQSRLSASTKAAATSATQQVRSPNAKDGAAARLGEEWWEQLVHSVPGDRVDLLQSYLRQHDNGKLSASSLATRARVLLVDSVNSAARTSAGGAVASKAVREGLVQQLAGKVGGD